MPRAPGRHSFTYGADMASLVQVLVANTSDPRARPQQILAHARRHRKSVSVAHLSPGTRSNLLGELLSEKSGRDILVVPYEGSAPAMVDLMGNQVQLTFELVSNVAPLVKAGKLKALAVVSAERIDALKAQRAVAQACTANPIAVAIACHRVARRDASMATQNVRRSLCQAYDIHHRPLVQRHLRFLMERRFGVCSAVLLQIGMEKVMVKAQQNAVSVQDIGRGRLLH